MPQTVEAINHAQAAGVPMVFAINKIDKPNANPDHIKEQLAQMNYLVEELNIAFTRPVWIPDSRTSPTWSVPFSTSTVAT